jgi:hypothetical protein
MPEPARPLTTKAGAKRRFNLANDSCQIATARFPRSEINYDFVPQSEANPSLGEAMNFPQHPNASQYS